MATITSNGTGGGLWSATATWVGAVVPANGDSVVIAGGDVVQYDYDNSADALGYLGIEVQGTLDLDPSSDIDTILKVNSWPAETGAIRAATGVGGHVGNVICGTDLDNGMALSRSVLIDHISTVSGDAVFQESEYPYTNGNKLNVNLFDGYGHIRRHAVASAWVSTIDYEGGLTCDYLISNVEAGDNDLFFICNVSNRRCRVTCDSITDNGDGTYDYYISGIPSATFGTIATSLAGDVPVVLMSFKSNIVIQGDAATGNNSVTASISTATICASSRRFGVLQNIGGGGLPAGNSWYGACWGIEHLSTGAAACVFAGAFASSRLGGIDEQTGGTISNGFRNNTFGVDEKSCFLGWDEVVKLSSNNYSTAQGTLNLSGVYILLEKFINYQGHPSAPEDIIGDDNNGTPMPANFHLHMSNLEVTYNQPTSQALSIWCKGFTPEVMDNVTLTQCHRLWDHDDLYETTSCRPKVFTDVVISSANDGDGGSVNAADTMKMDNSNLVRLQRVAANIAFNNLTLDGVLHDFYLLCPGDVTHGHGVVTTESSGVPSGFEGGIAQKLTFWSGFAPMYVLRQVYLKVGQKMVISASAKLDDLSSSAPRVEVLLEHQAYELIEPSQTPSPYATVFDFHDGTVTGVQSVDDVYTATREGLHHVYLVCWMEDQGESYGFGSEKIAWGTLTATASSGSTGRKMIPRFFRA